MFQPQALLSGLAVLILIIHLSNLFNPKGFKKAFKSFVGDENAVRLGGAMMLIVSFLFLTTHWKLEGGWILAISLFGWLTFLKGLTWIWNPKFVKDMSTKYMIKNDTTSTMASILAIIFAIFVIYIAVQLNQMPILAF